MRNTECHQESILKSPGLLWGRYIHSDLCQCYYFCLKPLLACGGRTVSAHLALICKAPAISTFGIAIRAPCAEKAMLRGISIGFPQNHSAEMLLGASLLIFSGLVSPWKICINARPVIEPQVQGGLWFAFPVGDTTIFSIETWWQWTLGADTVTSPSWEGKLGWF